MTLIALFCISICLPLADSAFNLDPTPTLHEFRKLTTLPEFRFKWNSFASYPDEFEQFFDDRLGFRNWLIQSRAVVWVKLLRSSTNREKVVIGKNGWLYRANPYYQPGRLFDSEQLDAWQAALEANRDYLDRQGVHYLVVFTPAKGTVYPEFMPDRYDRRGTQTRLDQLLKQLNEESDIDVLDLRQPMIDAKGEKLLYFTGDTHWNLLGAFIGYREIIYRLSLTYPALSAPMTLSDFTIAPKIEWSPTMYRMLGLENIIREKKDIMEKKTPIKSKAAALNLPVQPKFGKRVAWFIPAAARKVDDESLPSVVLFHNSFGNYLRPFLAEHFRRSFFSIYRYYHKIHEPASAIIEREKPDIVIHQIHESQLHKDEVFPEADLTLRNVE
jgi:hypothetical protein